MFKVTKTFGHDRGLSACFRQWRASHSHCRHLHGYSLAITLVFAATELDARNWVLDFGGFKQLEKHFKDTFDHKVLVAEDDPCKDELCALAGMDAAFVVVVPAVGCEQFAKQIADYVEFWLEQQIQPGRVQLLEVTVAEHGSNSASYCPPLSHGLNLAA
jgi:6-pyruvoyltetrahydropterin/6-carboxytetrahydropterin synthase